MPPAARMQHQLNELYQRYLNDVRQAVAAAPFAPVTLPGIPLHSSLPIPPPPALGPIPPPPAGGPPQEGPGEEEALALPAKQACPASGPEEPRGEPIVLV